MTSDVQTPSAELGKSVMLARLLNCRKPPSPGEFGKFINSTFPERIDKSTLQDLQKALESAGLLVPGQLILTDSGEREALRFLALSKAPTARRRQQRIKLALLANKLGKSVDQVAKLDKHKLAALILKQKFQLPPGSGSTLNAVLEALTCKLLGYPDAVRLQDLMTRKLSQEHGCRYDSNTVKTSGVATLLGVSQLRKDKLIQLVMTRSTPTTNEPKPTEVEEFDAEAFVSTVLKAAREVPTGRVRDDVVFINHVWNYLRSEAPFQTMGLHAFKQRLIEANREQKLHLIRADFPMYLNAQDVAESVCEDTGSYFHFIQLSRSGN